MAVRIADRLAQGLIVGGGIGTIVAVSMVCIFLAWVVLPLFWAPSIEPAVDVPPPWSSSPPWHVAVDEHQNSAWALKRDGSLDVVRLDPPHAGQLLHERKLFDNPSLSAAAFGLEGDEAAFGFADGSFLMGSIRMRTSFVDPKRLEAPFRGMKPGEVRLVEGDLVERTSQGQFRRQSLQIELGEPQPTGSAFPVASIDFSMRSSGPVLATLCADGSARLHSLRSVRSMETGETDYRTQTAELAYPQRSGRARPTRILVSGVGDNVLVAWRDGRLVRFDARNPRQPRLAEDIDLVSEQDASLTALGYLIGKATLVAGDSTGRIRGWFRVNRAEAGMPDGKTLVAAHELPGPGSAVRCLAPSARSRMLAAGYEDGSVRLFYMTTEELLLETRTEGPPSVLAVSPKDDGLLAVTPTRLTRWRIDVPHPEATLASLFTPLWYEGDKRPAHVWQSTGGNDTFEPKLGLWPLVFGTLKATFYSLLLGVPLALLAAIYTSEFLPPKARSRIKPTIELMASLPSVVLGFIAALLLAPLVEGLVPSVLTSIVTVVLALLSGGYLWQLLPSAGRVQLAPWRFVFMCLALPPGAAAGFWLGPLVERLLFAGDIKIWLNGGAGHATGGWMLLLLPLCGVATAWLLASRVNPILRRLGADWTAFQAAVFDLVKFVLAVLAALAAALAVSMALSAAGFDPRGDYLGRYEPLNALIVGFVMGFAIIPIIYTIAEDALSTVPEHLRSASLGAGATQWQTATRIIIPTAMSGLFSAVMIGLGRAVGETMIVVMAAGSTPVMEWNIFNGFRTLSANIATELPEAVRNSTHYRTLFLAALVLFSLTFILNTVAETVRQRFRKRAFQL
ncbi:MAG: ABC transporter permease subunit [Pirellulales bacterium]